MYVDVISVQPSNQTFRTPRSQMVPKCRFGWYGLRYNSCLAERDISCSLKKKVKDFKIKLGISNLPAPAKN